MALSLIAAYIEKTPFLHLAGRCANAQEAVQKMEEKTVDLLFLDIQMPGMTGITLANLLAGKGPRVIFTTAYDEYALKAFQVNSVDYMLKPVEEKA